MIGAWNGAALVEVFSRVPMICLRQNEWARFDLVIGRVHSVYVCAQLLSRERCYPDSYVSKYRFLAIGAKL